MASVLSSSSGCVPKASRSRIKHALSSVRKEVRNHPRASPIEIDALWILACCELEPQLARALITAGGGDGRALDVATLQRAVGIAGAVEIDDGLIANLVRHGLVETAWSWDLPTYLRPIRVSDRVLMLARGVTALDSEVAAFATLHDPDELAARRRALPPDLVAAFEQGATIVAHGPVGIGRRTLLSAIAARKNQPVLEVRSTRLGTDAMLDRQLRAVFREVRLFGAVPSFVDLDAANVIDALDRFDRGVRGPILVTAAKPLLFARRAAVNHEMAAPSADERRSIWSAHLDGASPRLLETIADSFAVSPATIVAAASSTLASVDGDPSRVSFATIHTSLRSATDERLAALATRVSVTQSWDDLVLPTEKQDQLLELLGRIRYRTRVLDEWGFADKVGRGTGLSALLSGPPGTGKTMVAGLVAKELGLDMYQVDLSRIVSKYIGETEKNLALVFDAAESGHAILLFDEADSLFAKRSEIRSSNDRYANQEVNFLLQRMERFRGVVLLTTNHERAIDEAFRRRLSLHIRFDAPDAEHRAKLWRAMLPALAPVEPDIDFATLGRTFEMAGGYIRNAVVRAAYLAAHDGRPISASHLSRAARAETEAMGRLVITSQAR